MQNRHATRTEHGNAQHNSSADSARGMYHDASAQGIDSSVDVQCPCVGVNAAFMIKRLLAGIRTLGGLARTQQPQQQEKRHHRGDEVSVGDFPGAAMVPAMAAFFDFFDDFVAFSIGSSM
mgnify:CR=1 FL=1